MMSIWNNIRTIYIAPMFMIYVEIKNRQRFEWYSVAVYDACRRRCRPSSKNHYNMIL